MPDITPDKAELIALFVETLLYGIFVVLFYDSIRILTSGRKGVRLNWLLILASAAIFVTATGHLVMILCRALDAFIDYRNKPGGPIKYYGNLRSALEVSQASFQVAVSLLGDGMAVYRVYIVYNRRYISIILPLISFFGTIVTSIASVVIIGQSSTRASAFYFPKLETWMPIFFGLTFSTSVICTGLIAFRLWHVRHNLASHISSFGTTGRETSKLVQRILIESATMYSTIIFIYLVTYLAKTNYSIIFGDMVAPIIGITFSAITIRVNTVFNPDTTYPNSITHTSMPLSYIPNSIDFKESSMKPVPLSVRIHKEVNRHGVASSTTNVAADSSEAL